MTATEAYCDVGLHREDGATVVHVSGEIDLFGAPALRDALERATALPDPVVIDLADCTFLDSNGLHALLTAHLAAERDGRPILVARARDGCAERLLEVTAPGRFPRHTSRADALGALAV